MILCCEGFFLVMGIFVLSFRELRLGGRVVGGQRLVAIGLLLLLQAPLAIFLGGQVLGDVPPGALDGAPAREGLIRFWANITEIGIILMALILSGVIWLNTPSTNENEEEGLEA